MAIAMPAAINAYSIAVTPSSPFQKSFNCFHLSSTFCKNYLLKIPAILTVQEYI